MLFGSANTPSAQERADIQNLVACYGLYFDYRQATAWASLFTADGTFSFPTIGGPPNAQTVVTGTDALIAFATNATSPGPVFAHYPGQTFLLRTDSDSMRAFTTVGVVMVDSTQQFSAQFQALGAYDDLIVKTPHGWRFKTRSATIYGETELPAEFLPHHN